MIDTTKYQNQYGGGNNWIGGGGLTPQTPASGTLPGLRRNMGQGWTPQGWNPNLATSTSGASYGGGSGTVSPTSYGGGGGASGDTNWAGGNPGFDESAPYQYPDGSWTGGANGTPTNMGGWPQAGGGMLGPPGWSGGGSGGGGNQYATSPSFGVEGFNNYPREWQVGSDVLQGFAQTGMPTDIPREWQLGSRGAEQMMRTGMPTNYDPWYQQAKQVAQTDTQDAINQAAEQAGMGGTRWGSPLGRTAQDIAGRRMAELGTTFTGQQLGALESARGRQQQAINQMYQYGQGTSGLSEAARNRGLQAGGMLGSLGGQMAQYPMDLANQSNQIGAGLQGLDQAALNRQYQEFMRQTPEASPWLNMIMGMSTLSGQPQMYNSGLWTQFLQGAQGLFG